MGFVHGFASTGNLSIFFEYVTNILYNKKDTHSTQNKRLGIDLRDLIGIEVHHILNLYDLLRGFMENLVGHCLHHVSVIVGIGV